GNLRRRADGRNDVESSVQEENLERRFRLAALRSERAELYHLRATREISNDTLQKQLRDLSCKVNSLAVLRLNLNLRVA
ncbi:hypothetical protein UXB74_23460, partial [Escherichia marmotae]|nr:hypothetical protein [Escherichia marmotae]